jgi:hypothetical protein
MIPEHINPMQWHQAVGIARQSCARFFRDGATAKDAMRAFGADAGAAGVADWGKAVGRSPDASPHAHGRPYGSSSVSQ